MDILYIPQLDDGDAGESPTSGRYRLLRRSPEDGTVLLSDRAVTRVDVASAEPLRIVLPPQVRGAARDFLVRLVITADEIPEVTFAAPSGETVSFEDVDEDVFACETGINVFAFTETEDGAFIVNRRRIGIDVTVAFRPCGGILAEQRKTFTLGARYLDLPHPIKDGFRFAGWYTAAEGGEEVCAADRCRTGVTELFAHWETYVDPFVFAICPAGNLTFFSDGEPPWRVDSETFVTAPGSARSGVIPHGAGTSIVTTLEGRGTLSFKWKVSCEEEYDRLCLTVDGEEVAAISGERDWQTFERTFDGDGLHNVVWRYEKDDYGTDGEDAAWIDEVVWTPAEE